MLEKLGLLWYLSWKHPNPWQKQLMELPIQQQQKCSEKKSCRDTNATEGRTVGGLGDRG